MATGTLLCKTPPPPPFPESARSGHPTKPALVLAAAILLGLAAAAVATGQPASSRSDTQPAPAQPEAAESAGAAFTFGLTLEGYYEYNWNRPYDRVNLLRAYDTRANVFSLQQVAVVIDGAPDVESGRRLGARLDLQFGQATETVQGNPANEPRPHVYRHVWQAYGTYVFPVGRGLQADFGKFASNLGIETGYAKDNNHFSRAFLFNFLPFYHSGLRLALPITDWATATYMLTNGIQQTEDFNDFKSHHLTAMVKPTGQVAWTVNYYFGREQPDGGLPGGPDGYFRVFDTYVTYAPTRSLGLGLDVNYATNELRASDPSLSLQGLGAYGRYQVSTPVALAVRYERLDDEGLFGGVEQVLQGLTATAAYTLADGFLVRAEFRRDWSNRRFFTSDEPDDLRDGQNTLLVGAVWWLGNKQGAW